MDRTTWAVAWRHARRITGRQRSFGEARHLDVAQRELGGDRLTLVNQCIALECVQARLYGPSVASFRAARSRRLLRLGDLCRDRWEREEREAAGARIFAVAVPYTPRDPRKFMQA